MGKASIPTRVATGFTVAALTLELVPGAMYSLAAGPSDGPTAHPPQLRAPGAPGQPLPPATAPTLAPHTPVVRDGYWLEYQPGELRGCDGCHGVNTTNQAGLPASSNTPQALIDLLNWWRLHDDRIFVDGFDP